MGSDLRGAFTVVIALLGGSVLAGCSQPAQSSPGVDHGGCSVGGVTDFSPGRSVAKSPKEAIVTWLATTRGDLSSNIRAYLDATTHDRGAIADRATLDALQSVDEVLAQNTAVQVETSGERAKLVGVDQSGRFVAITVARRTVQEPPDWMVTEYSIDLANQWCTQLPSNRPR